MIVNEILITDIIILYKWRNNTINLPNLKKLYFSDVIPKYYNFYQLVLTFSLLFLATILFHSESLSSPLKIPKFRQFHILSLLSWRDRRTTGAQLTGIKTLLLATE